MMKNILYYTILLVLIFYILINIIGLRGVYVDPWLTEVKKNKFLIEYSITLILLIIAVVFLKIKFK